MKKIYECLTCGRKWDELVDYKKYIRNYDKCPDCGSKKLVVKDKYSNIEILRLHAYISTFLLTFVYILNVPLNLFYLVAGTISVFTIFDIVWLRVLRKNIPESIK